MLLEAISQLLLGPCTTIGSWNSVFPCYYYYPTQLRSITAYKPKALRRRRRRDLPV
ncbi:hypothetical protein Hanom_Chr15g01338321 [Helianthus anomalus]